MNARGLILLILGLLSFSGCASGPSIVMKTAAMQPTIPEGSTFSVQLDAFESEAPFRYELVMFQYQAQELSPPIQQPADGSVICFRIVGLPGETIELTNAGLFINGQPAPPLPGIRFEPAPDSSEFQRFNSVTLPEGAYFLLGDNSPRALDGRYWGYVTIDQIQGKVVPRNS